MSASPEQAERRLTQLGHLWPHLGRLDQVAERVFQVLPQTRYAVLPEPEFEKEEEREELREERWLAAASGKFSHSREERAALGSALSSAVEVC